MPETSACYYNRTYTYSQHYMVIKPVLYRVYTKKVDSLLLAIIPKFLGQSPWPIWQMKAYINLNIMWIISQVWDPFSHSYDHCITSYQRTFFNTLRSSWKQPVLEPREWWQWIKLCALMSSNYHFHNLNVASADYQFSPATPITNTIQS